MRAQFFYNLGRHHMALQTQLDELTHRILPVVQDFHRKGMFAPHAASFDTSGEISGHALTTDGTAQHSVSKAIEYFEATFKEKGASGEITATGIFYHSPGVDTSAGIVSLPPANNTDDCKTLVGLLEHASGQSVYLVIPYSGRPPDIEYAVGKLIGKPPRIFIVRGSQEKRSWWKVW